MTRILIGADPEVFVRTRHAPVSAHGLVEGTKYQPFKVDKGAVQVDGMALEFNIDPAGTRQDFISNVQHVYHQLNGMVRAKDPRLRFDYQSLVQFTRENYSEQPDIAKELGCEPDMDAWTGEFNPTPTPKHERDRSAGGHVHIGWTDRCEGDEHEALAFAMGRQLDFALGLPSVVEDTRGVARRALYGQAGAMRVKGYGMEYRTLSNYWVFKTRTVGNIYDRAHKAATDLLDKDIEYVDKFGDIRELINVNTTENVKAARSISEELGFLKPARG